MPEKQLAVIVDVDNNYEEIGTIPAHILETWQPNERVRSAPLTEEQCRDLSHYLRENIGIGYAFFKTNRILVGLKD